METHSRSQRQGGFRPAASAHDTTTTSETRRPLLLPQEVKAIGPDKAILLVENVPPILAHKIVYYRDRVFQRRRRPPAPVPRIDIPPQTVRGATTPTLHLNYDGFTLPKDEPLDSADLENLATQWLQAAYAQAPPD